MKILVLSDLHEEHWKGRAPKLSAGDADIVVLAGDIHGHHNAVKWAIETFPDVPVLYIHGNHEGYSDNLDGVQIKIAEACQGTNVHFLNQGTFLFHDVLFIGATLWSDFRLYGDENRQKAMMAAKNSINDYHCIRLASKGYHKLEPEDTRQWHKAHKAFIVEQLAWPEDFRKRIVITHMGPSIKSVAEQYAGDACNPYYVSALDDLVAKADLWIHGHTHVSRDYMIENCRVVCNPRGYPMRNRNGDISYENPTFNPGFMVEV